MPWRAGRRWWCGCDGGGVRRRRARGRRRWSGGGGYWLYRFTYRAVAAPGVVAVPPQGSSRQNGPRACRGLPGAWAAAPA